MEADPNLRILIRADGNTKYKINEQVMTACAEAGANDLIYSAFEE
jgi:biopolymer transport protein ExbD